MSVNLPLPNGSDVRPLLFAARIPMTIPGAAFVMCDHDCTGEGAGWSDEHAFATLDAAHVADLARMLPGTVEVQLPGAPGTWHRVI